ncbi:MAG: uracil phosphoribosyltransferase [Cyclobacteriaceae bacterium]|nr:MAG: uracil phosphoribosyltransferase [Cyclobacteriaceae bacterium]
MQQNIFVLNAVNSIANQIILELRDGEAQLDRGRFRRNLVKLGAILAYELSKSLQYKTVEVDTVLGKSSVNILESPPVLYTIIRAGLPFLEGFQQFFESSDCGFIGAHRIEEKEEIAVTLGYSAIAPFAKQDLILVDPMLATGKSTLTALESILQNGSPGMLHLVFAIAAPEGLENLTKCLDIPYKIWVGAVDECLNQNGYIVPGLGDAGDLLFGKKI